MDVVVRVSGGPVRAYAGVVVRVSGGPVGAACMDVVVRVSGGPVRAYAGVVDSHGPKTLKSNKS